MLRGCSRTLKTPNSPPLDGVIGWQTPLIQENVTLVLSSVCFLVLSSVYRFNSLARFTARQNAVAHGSMPRLFNRGQHRGSKHVVSSCQSMEWIELKRSSPVQIHEALILIQSNPADDPDAESSPVQSGHNRVGIYQIPYKVYIHVRPNDNVYS